MQRHECEAIIFDMDGILVDSEALNEKHWQIWAEKKNIALDAIMSIHHGLPAIQTITTVAPHLDAAVEARWFETKLSSDMEGLLAFDGVKRLLDGLPEGRWGIGTSAPQIIAMNRLRYLQLPIPPIVVTIDDVERGKPAPDPYLLAAARLGKDPEVCIVIEDAPAGIEAAQAAGSRVFAIPTTNSPESLQHADAIIPRFADLSVMPEAGKLIVQW